MPRPKITAEFVSLNEDLVPASLDMHGDMLPADQHPSYPFGNLFGPLGGAIAADSAIVGGAHGTSASRPQPQPRLPQDWAMQPTRLASTLAADSKD